MDARTGRSGPGHRGPQTVRPVQLVRVPARAQAVGRPTRSPAPTGPGSTGTTRRPSGSTARGGRRAAGRRRRRRPARPRPATGRCWRCWPTSGCGSVSWSPSTSPTSAPNGATAASGSSARAASRGRRALTPDRVPRRLAGVPGRAPAVAELTGPLFVTATGAGWTGTRCSGWSAGWPRRPASPAVGAAVAALAAARVRHLRPRRGGAAGGRAGRDGARRPAYHPPLRPGPAQPGPRPGVHDLGRPGPPRKTRVIIRVGRRPGTSTSSRRCTPTVWRRHYRARTADARRCRAGISSGPATVWRAPVRRPAGTATFVAEDEGADGDTGGDGNGLGRVRRTWSSTHDDRWGSLVDNLHVTGGRSARRDRHRLHGAAVRAVLAAGGAAADLHLWVLEQNAAANGSTGPVAGCTWRRSAVGGDPRRLTGAPNK